MQLWLEQLPSWMRKQPSLWSCLIFLHLFPNASLPLFHFFLILLAGDSTCFQTLPTERENLMKITFMTAKNYHRTVNNRVSIKTSSSCFSVYDKEWKLSLLSLPHIPLYRNSVRFQIMYAHYLPFSLHKITFLMFSCMHSLKGNLYEYHV